MHIICTIQTFIRRFWNIVFVLVCLILILKIQNLINGGLSFFEQALKFTKYYIFKIITLIGY